MKIQVREATPIQLDWAVAKCEGYKIGQLEDFDTSIVLQRPNGSLSFIKVGNAGAMRMLNHGLWRPSTDWAQGGPIIEREEIGTKRRAPCFPKEQWEAAGSITAKGAGYWFAVGPTPLIAAMRCYVASKLGDEVEIPDELCTSPS